MLGSDEDFWHRVGIDPVRMMTGAGTFFTLRCYLDDAADLPGPQRKSQRVRLWWRAGPLPGRRARP